ncbi:unnamed protein product [[Candida] boidinii]|uniref:Glutamyl-tRNA(Gln) amidotransferase subunit B, mitochondrial n=1 Tax=Candida boidinii TaxID=5477 RepID=A0A9W6T340_CANBO|nr:hypothetical protein B5S30_g1461 [[Candida] boidinii]GME73062.1 unnamed protein product [[Candida] boidinii]GMG17764.1 unnamed protein product [[Candida] boidinii]
MSKLSNLRKLKCGLEIHSQLNTKKKLFSLSSTPNLSTPPNTTVSFFDLGLPGTQPKLNLEAVLFAVKTSIALNCRINPCFTFDRKHYFYGDQPLGYQITQHYNPIAKDGFLELSPKYDGAELKEPCRIRIEQLQLEQDTGKSIYKLNNGTSQIDFNRADVPLIEMVTKPDFQNIDQVKAFIKKFQYTLKNLGVCTGELETGAMRVDVNISVDDNARIEMKNLPTTSAVTHAIRYEYKRQCKILDQGGKISQQETRGWDGKMTVKLRSKEGAIEYRYMPDPELNNIKLNIDDLVRNIKPNMPKTIDERLEVLLASPYNLKLRDANILVSNEELLEYYNELYELTVIKGKVSKNPINWLTHELMGCLSRSNKEFNKDLIKVDKLSELIIANDAKIINNNNTKLLLLHLINNPQDQNEPISKLIKEYDLANGQQSDGNSTSDNKSGDDNSELVGIVCNVIKDNGKVVDEIKEKGKIKKINFLIGQCMRSSGGKCDPSTFERLIKKELELV